jgi:ACS family glucarate transporter-like MFS transporter
MFGLSAMSYIDRTAMSIAAPIIIPEFHLSETEMGTVFSAFILSYALLMAPGGRLADRLGPRLVLGLVSAGASLFTFLTAAVGRIPFPALPSLLGIRLGLGACTSPLYPACARMTCNWLPVSQHARTQGFILSGAAVGSAITPLLFARLIALYGWRTSFALAAVATALLALVWFHAVRDRPAGAAAASPAGDVLSWRPLFTNRNLALLTLGYFTLNYFEYIFFYWIYYYFGEIRKAGSERSAVYTTIMLLTMAAMMPLGGWVSDRLTPRWGARTARRSVALAGMILSAVLLYIGTSLERPLPVAALLSLALGFCVTAEGPFWASAIEAGSAQAGSATGIMNGVGNLGGLLAPVLTPFIAQRAGWSWGLYAASLVVLLGAVSWLFVNPDRS